MATKYKSKFTGEQIDNSVETIVSNTATNGQVLTANGTGGATWQDAMGGGTEVVANPVLSGTESDLTGLEVAGTKYKVPSGGGFYVYLYEYNDVKYFQNYTLTNAVKIRALLITNSQLNIIDGQLELSHNGIYNFFLVDYVSNSELLSIGTALPIIEDSNLRIILPNFASYNYNNHYVGYEFNKTTGKITDAIIFNNYFGSFKNSSGIVILPTIRALTN